MVLTLLLSTLACVCEEDNALSECFAEVTQNPCYNAGGFGGTVRYVPTGSECVSCDSPCRDVVAIEGSLVDLCIPNCKFKCN
jgi:hypothetical protein